jgi:CheY-specific phosphatase CheX
MSRLSRLQLAVLSTLVPVVAMAQSAGKIESGLQKAANWAAGVAVLIGIFGFIRASIKYNTGDADAKEAAKSAFVGSALALCAGPLILLMKSWFG